MHVHLAPDATISTIEGKTVLFSKRTGDFFGLNDSAAYMVRAALESDVERAIAKCAADYEVDPVELGADLRSLLDELAKLRLVELR